MYLTILFLQLLRRIPKFLIMSSLIFLKTLSKPILFMILYENNEKQFFQNPEKLQHIRGRIQMYPLQFLSKEIRETKYFYTRIIIPLKKLF